MLCLYVKTFHNQWNEIKNPHPWPQEKSLEKLLAFPIMMYYTKDLPVVMLGETLIETTPLWPCTITCMGYFMTEGLVRNSELTNHHQPKEFEKGQREMPHVLPNFQNPPLWTPILAE